MLAREKARTAALTKVWWVPYHKRADHPTPYHKNSLLPTPIPGPHDMYAQAPSFTPTTQGSVPNTKKRPRERCSCVVCTKPRTHRTVKTQTYDSTLSPGWHDHLHEETLTEEQPLNSCNAKQNPTPPLLTGRGPKQMLIRRRHPTEPPSTTTLPVQPTQQPNVATYSLNVGPSQLHYDLTATEHATRGWVLQTLGFPDFRAATREGMVEMITSTERTIRVLMQAPSYSEAASDFHLNRAMHQYGYAITVQSNHLLLMSMGQDREIRYTYFYALGSRVSIQSQTFTVRNFWRYIAAKFPAPRTMTERPTQPPSIPRRQFAEPAQDGIIDFNQLFPAEHINFIRDFDMDNIGRYKIRTVKNIQAKDVHIYRRILTSALHGVLTAQQSVDQQSISVACRFLFLVPPILLRSPAKSVPQRLDAFLAGDLKQCARGLMSIQDNYVRRVDRTPLVTKHQAAAACVFDGQFSKAVQALLRQETNTTQEARKAAMVAKHPPRSKEDDQHIQALPPDKCGTGLRYTTQIVQKGNCPGPKWRQI